MHLGIIESGPVDDAEVMVINGNERLPKHDEKENNIRRFGAENASER